MAADGALSFSVASVVEDVLQQHGNRSRNLDLDAWRQRKQERYEAAAWLRKVVGFVGAKDLPAEPSEEDFRLGLRSGIILCNVVESPVDSALIPDGATVGIPGGKSSRVVNCVLGLKAYSEWKHTGGTGAWKFGGNVKSTTSAKQFVRKNSEPFSSSLSRSMSMNEKYKMVYALTLKPSSSLSNLVRAILVDKKPEEVPNLVESVLNKVVEEFEQRIASQIQLPASAQAATSEQSNSKGLNSFLRQQVPSESILRPAQR
ncbi:hypothetical protein HAX54_001752 [Datura stramonium]|uniref:Calponin-homology (CH) domain-containing protein n=1 Tax=Datura stramonium TaxID=4076 RepID=A0ABS8RSQ4_DATST|nr:hypothetical protein [Datura stramonium]